MFKIYPDYQYGKEHTIVKLKSENLPVIRITMLNPDFTLTPTKEQKQQAQASWEVKRDNQLVGHLEYEEATFPKTADFYYFLRYKPVVDEKESLQIQVNILSSTANVEERHIVYPPVPQGNRFSIENSQWSKPAKLAGEGALPRHSLYLDGSDFSAHLNMVNLYEPLGNGVRKVHHDEINSMYYRGYGQEKRVEFSFPHRKGWEAEQWGMIGKEGLFAWNDPKQNELKLKANFDMIRKWTREGIQYIPDATYVPYDPWAFWVVPAQHVGEKLLLYGQDRFAKNMAMLSLDAAIHTQTKDGHWISQPQSSWLYKDYGIDAGFYDTRFNTDAALFLLDGHKRLGNEEYLSAAEKYGDFLVQYAKSHHFPTDNGGYLVHDYSQDLHSDTVTHVSLNHLLAEMNFLYELYGETKKDHYLTTAEKMRTAVKDTKDHWVKKDNGDLWYAILIDGTYGMQDYMHLTLKDLRESQRILEKLEGKRDPDLEELIQAKEAFLKKRGAPLYDWEDLLFGEMR